jgi:hypothetical protein
MYVREVEVQPVHFVIGQPVNALEDARPADELPDQVKPDLPSCLGQPLPAFEPRCRFTAGLS